MDWEDEEHRTALREASFGGHLEIVELLLEHRADLNIQGEDVFNGEDLSLKCTGRGILRDRTPSSVLKWTSGNCQVTS